MWIDVYQPSTVVLQYCLCFIPAQIKVKAENVNIYTHTHTHTHKQKKPQKKNQPKLKTKHTIKSLLNYYGNTSTLDVIFLFLD